MKRRTCGLEKNKFFIDYAALKLKKLVDIYEVNGILYWYCKNRTKTKVTVKTQATQYALDAAAADPAVAHHAKSLHVEAPR